MKRTHRNLIRIAAVPAGLLPALAMAHPGHGETASFAAGAFHPVSGVDHIAGLFIVGVLVAQLGGRYLWPMAAMFLGLLVAAWTTDSDGWQFAAGFMLSGAGLVAAGVAAHSAATRLFAVAAIAAGRRSPT